MSKVFIDIGGHIGQSIDKFYAQIDNASTWKIFSFEPIQYQKLLANTKKYDNVECIEAAAGIEDEKITMFLVPSCGQGATTLEGKLTGWVNYKDKLSVNSIDFVRWFRDNINSNDFVVIKMNIEGGEYVLMPRLLEIMPQIAGLWIKMHHSKFNAVQKSKMLKIYADFKLEISRYKAFVYCDVTEKKYDFKWIISKIYKKLV